METSISENISIACLRYNHMIPVTQLSYFWLTLLRSREIVEQGKIIASVAMHFGDCFRSICHCFFTMTTFLNNFLARFY